MRVLIISGGQIEVDFADSYVDAYRPEYVIAADRGMEYCRYANIIPNYIVGDFDSVSGETLEYFQNYPEIVWKKFRPEKDETDTELALSIALQHSATEIHILGATGSRLDHVMGNIQLLYHSMIQDIPTFIVDAHNRIRLIDGELTLKKREQFGKYVSLLPLTTNVTGLTLKGFQYPLEDATLYSTNTLGISNQILEEQARIEIGDGMLVVIESRD